MFQPIKLLLLLLLLQDTLVSGDIHARAVGKVRKFCKDRRIEYNLHLNIRSKLPEIDVGIGLLSDICYDQKLNKICHRNIDNIVTEFAKFKNKWEIIELNDITSTMRRKRYVDNELLQSNNVTTKILKKAMDLADQGYADLRNKIEELRKEVTYIVDSQNKLSEYVGYINFHSISQVLFETIHQLNSVTESILRLIVENDTPSLLNLIDLNNIRQQLQKLDNQAIKSNCTVPFGKSSFHLIQFLKLCSFRVRVLGNIISIGIKVPTVSVEVFTLVEPVSLPFAVKGSTYKEKPLHDNLLIHESNIDLRLYVPLSDRERSECKTLPDQKLICYPTEPVLTDRNFNVGDYDGLFSADTIDCATVMMDRDIEKTRCPLVEIPHRNMIIRYESDIFTIYIVQPTRITLDCPDKLMELIYNKTSSLAVPKSCSVYMDNLLMVEKYEIPAYEVIYLSNTTSGIYITKNDLLNSEILDKVNLTKEFRDLNPDFEEINNEIEQQISSIRGFLAKWRLKDEVLLSVIISLSLSIVLNWFTTCYYVRKLRRSHDVQYMEARPVIPISMKKMSPIKSFKNRLQSIERDFIKPIGAPHSESLMLNHFNVFDRQSSLPTECVFPMYPLPQNEQTSLMDNRVETTVNFDPNTGEFQTEEAFPPLPSFANTQ